MKASSKIRNLLFTITTVMLIVFTAFMGAMHGIAAGAVSWFVGCAVLGADWGATPAVLQNTLGTLSGELILQRALQLCFLKRPALRMISMGFKELDGRVENALLGQNVKARLRTEATVNDFGTGPSDVTTTDVTLTLSATKEIYHQFSLAEVNQTDRNLIDEQAEPIAVALGNHIVDAVAGLWTNANYANKATVASAWSYVNTVLALKGKLDVAKTPDSNRFFTHTSAVELALLDDDNIVRALNNPMNGNAIATGKLPAVAGLQLAPYYALPDNGENLVGFAGTPDASAYVARAPKNPEDALPGAKFPGIIGYVEDPLTGFRVMVNQWIDSDLSINNRIVWMEGYGVGNAANGCRLVTA